MSMPIFIIVSFSILIWPSLHFIRMVSCCVNAYIFVMYTIKYEHTWFFFLVEIESCILKIVNDQKLVYWDDFVLEMKDFIIAKYDGKSLATYKGDWKKRFKSNLKQMRYVFGGSVDDNWSEIIDSALKSYNRTKKSINDSTTNTESNRKITDKEKHTILKVLDRVSDSEKWVLSSGTIIDDVMRRVIQESVYEHPVHSLIMDPSDPLWISYLTATELDEIRTFNLKALKTIPSSLQEYIDSYDKPMTAKEIRKHAFSHFLDPTTEFDKQWIQQSMIAGSDLFQYEDMLNLDDYSESDLLQGLWSFVYNLFKDRYIRANLGDQCNVAVSAAKNDRRSLEAIEKRPRKVMGAKVDILFKYGSNEVGTCKVGKEKAIEIDDKYLNDGLVKLPKTLRDMLSVLVKKNPSHINRMVTVGYLMMGNLIINIEI
jgi:hypothetical protein